VERSIESITKSEPLKGRPGKSGNSIQHYWRRIMLKNIAIFAFVTLASPALANGLPHTQDEWFVNSGRYLNGQVVSYPAPSQKRIVAYAESRHARLNERRASVTVGMWSFPQSLSGREQMVRATGA